MNIRLCSYRLMKYFQLSIIMITIIHLSNKFNYWNVRGIMNTSGLLQCKRPEVLMIPWTFQKIEFITYIYISFIKGLLRTYKYIDIPFSPLIPFWKLQLKRPGVTSVSAIWEDSFFDSMGNSIKPTEEYIMFGLFPVYRLCVVSCPSALLTSAPFWRHHSLLIWLDCFSVMMHCID